MLAQWQSFTWKQKHSQLPKFCVHYTYPRQWTMSSMILMLWCKDGIEKCLAGPCHFTHQTGPQWYQPQWFGCQTTCVPQSFCSESVFQFYLSRWLRWIPGSQQLPGSSPDSSSRPCASQSVWGILLQWPASPQVHSPQWYLHTGKPPFSRINQKHKLLLWIPKLKVCQ